MADRLVDYTAALLRQLERHLSSNDFSKASSRLALSTLLPEEDQQERRSLGKGEDEQRQRQREREDERLKSGENSFSQETHQRAARGEFYKNGGEGTTDLQEREFSELIATGHQSSPQHGQQVEGLLIVFRALLTFIVTALRPPFHQKNLSLLFAVLRLFPLDVSISLISQFQAAWLYTQAVQGKGRQHPSRENPTDLSRPRDRKNQPSQGNTEETDEDLGVKILQKSEDLGGEKTREDGAVLQREEREEEEERKNEKRGEDYHVTVATAFEQHQNSERERKEEDEETRRRRRRRQNEEDLMITSSAEKVTRVGLLIGGELKLVVDLVTFFTNAIDDAVQDGSILEEDVRSRTRRRSRKRRGNLSPFLFSQ